MLTKPPVNLCLAFEIMQSFLSYVYPEDNYGGRARSILSGLEHCLFTKK